MTTPTFKALTPAGEWVEGYRYDLWNPIQGNRIPVIDKSDRFDQDGDSVAVVEVLPETVCMATGRTDSKGKMMFNGDVIIFEDTLTPMQTGTECEAIQSIGAICWNNEECKFYVTNIQSADIIDVWDSATLTGKNIHDKTAGK